MFEDNKSNIFKDFRHSFNELITIEKNEFKNEKNKISINIFNDKKKEIKSNIDESKLNINDVDEKQIKIKDKGEI